MVIFTCFNSSVFAIETVCKLEVLNCQASYRPNAQTPVVNLRETTTIRVYGRYANWVTNAYMIDNITPDRNSLHTVDIQLNNKHDANTPCATYIDIVIPPNGLFAGRQVISMRGKPFNIGLEGEIFRFEIEAIRPPQVGNFYFSNTYNTLITEITAGVECLLSMNISTKQIGFNSQDFIKAAENEMALIDFSRNNFKIIGSPTIVSEGGSSFDGSSRFKCTYKVIFENKQSRYLFDKLNYSVNSNYCVTNVFSNNYSGQFLVKVISGRVDLVDDGLQGKFGIQFQECNGLQLHAASSNRRTLDSVRVQIPAPTAAEPSVQRVITWPDIRWGVKNIGESTTTSFQVQLLDGNTVLQTVTVNGLAAGENKIFKYRRPNSLIRMRRSICNPDVLFLNSAPPRNIAELEASQQYNWSEPAKYKIKIDINNTVQEINESNNIKEY